MQLPYIMGTELTGIHMGYRNSQEDMYSRNWATVERRRNQDLNDVKCALRSSYISYYNVHHDDHCIEVSSLKIETFGDMKQFSIKTRKVLEDHFYYPKNPTAVCGGAHVHVGIPHQQKRLKYELCRDLLMRPYLPWIFGEPDEEGAMDVLIDCADQYKEYKGLMARGEYAFHMSNEMYIESLILPYNGRTDYARMSNRNGKSHMFRLAREFGTIEFRFMEMAPTWEEQELQLHFICQYMKWMRKRVEAGKTTEIHLITWDAMQEIKPKTCADLFAELCYDIKVDYEEFKPFIKRNLYPRWEAGRTRL